MFPLKKLKLNLVTWRRFCYSRLGPEKVGRPWYLQESTTSCWARKGIEIMNYSPNHKESSFQELVKSANQTFFECSQHKCVQVAGRGHTVARTEMRRLLNEYGVTLHFQDIMMAITFYVLIGDELRILWFPKIYDGTFQVCRLIYWKQQRAPSACFFSLFVSLTVYSLVYI